MQIESFGLNTVKSNHAKMIQSQMNQNGDMELRINARLVGWLVQVRLNATFSPKRLYRAQDNSKFRKLISLMNGSEISGE